MDTDEEYAPVGTAAERFIESLGELSPGQKMRAAIVMRLARELDDAEAPSGAMIKEFRALLSELEPPAPPAAAKTGTDDDWDDLGAPG